MKSFRMLFIKPIVTALAAAVLLSCFAAGCLAQGNAIKLNGTEFFRTTLWDGDLFGATNKNFSFEFWFNAQSPGVLVGESDTADVRLWDVAFAEVETGGVVKMGAPGVPTTDLGTVAFNSWHHLAVVYNQTNSTLSGYLDGVLAGSASGARKLPSSNDRQAVYPFGRNGPKNLGDGGWFAGLFDEVRIWRVARTEAEVKLFWNQLSPPPSTNLMAVWHMDATDPSTVSLIPDAAKRGNPALHVPENAPTLVASTAPISTSDVPVVVTVAQAFLVSGVQLNCLANPGGLPASIHFEYGLGAAFDQSTPARDIGNGSSTLPYSEIVTNLSPGLYRFRAVISAGGTVLRGGALEFTQKSVADMAAKLGGSQYIRTEKWSDALFNGEDFTFELWFNAEGPGVLIGEADTAGATQWDFAFAEIIPGGELKVGVPGVSTISAGSVAFEKWRHLAVVYSNAAKELRAYLDGALVGTGAGDRQAPFEGGRTSVYTYGRGGVTNLGPGNWYRGLIDEVRIWRIAKSDAEIRTSWNRFAAPEAAGLVTDWHLDALLTDPTFSADVSPLNSRAWFVPSGTLPLEPSTAPLLPGIPASVVTGSAGFFDGGLTLNGSSNPRGSPASAFFEWGQTTAYGNSTRPVDIGDGQSPVAFFEMLTNVAIGEYRFRAAVVSLGSTNYGEDKVVFLLGPAGKAASLKGAEFIRTSRSEAQSLIGKDFTIELWFNAAGPGVLIGELDATDVTQWDYAFAEITAAGVLKVGVPGVPPVSLGALAYGSWRHLAVSYDGSLKKLSAYLDGKPVGTSEGERLIPADSGRKALLAFGRGGPTNLGQGAWLTGLLDEVRIWNRSLGAEEIEANHGLKIAGPDSSLVAYWHLDASSGTSSDDASGKSNPPFLGGAGLVPSLAWVSDDFRPRVTEQTVSNLSALTVQFQGRVSTLGTGTNGSYYFEYGLADFDRQTKAQPVETDQSVQLAALVDGLAPGGVYKMRIVGSNVFGRAFGQPVLFEKSSWANSALRFSTNDYIRTVSSLNSKLIDDAITVELWFKPIKAGVLASENNFPTLTGLDRSILEVSATGSVEAGFDGVPQISLGTAVFGEWNHVALRYDRAAGRMDGFVNGVKSAASLGDRVSPAERSLNGFLAFGKGVTTKLASGTTFFGDMDEIRVWNVARTDGDILSTRSLRLSGAEPGLIVYWRLDEATGTPLTSMNAAQINGQNLGAERVPSSAPVSQPIIPVAPSASGGFRLQFFGIPNSSYRVFESEDLRIWTPISTNTATSQGVFEFEIQAGPFGAGRFYKAALQ